MRFLKTTTYPKLACIGLIGLALPWFAYSQSTGDAALNAIRTADRNDRAAKEASQLTSAEHLRRGTIYLANRLFNEAREHWQAIINNPNDTNTPAALLGMARSYYVERRYEEARQTYERVARDYPLTKEGREGLNFSASSLLRMGRGVEAAARYAEYLEKYPNGERVDTAHLNIIDGYRESGRTRDAIDWIERTKQKFPGTVTETGANFARVRLDIAIGDWPHAVQTADELMQRPLPNGSNTTADELLYLKAHALQRAGRLQDAIRTYLMIPDNGFSYYGDLATAKLRATGDATANQRAAEREAAARTSIGRTEDDYPVPYRFQILKEASKRGVDPRFILAIMRQESQFKPGARSPSAARGLLQLTIDAARKYGNRAGIGSVSEDSLYRPEVSIAIGAEYLAELSRMFAGLHEAMAAAYNGGEDNVARWLARSNQNDPGVFSSEVGFSESKNYVFKVMANYRAYRQLYDAKLNRR